MKSPLLLLSLFVFASVLFSACESGCEVCTGDLTPERVFCEDDYQEDGRFEKEIREFEACCGICEEE